MDNIIESIVKDNVMNKKSLAKKEVIKILDLLKEAYPDAGCALVHRNVYELIICVVLSAQTTDVSVNKISDRLFDAYPDAASLAKASQENVIQIIKSIGMYKTKSKNIIALAQALCEKHNGEVPEDYDDLVALPGVGRKTANVVLSVGFGHQRIAVDTHVFRVSHRIGLAGASSVTQRSTSANSIPKQVDVKNAKPSTKSSKSATVNSRQPSAKSAGAAEVLATEKELMKVLPNERWTEAHHSLIWHGRNCCTARNPKCDICPIANLCSNRI